jgi:hypothetical protein
MTQLNEDHGQCRYNLQRRTNVMTDNAQELHQADEALLATEVSDEALEASAAIASAAYTLGACTGLSVCPG